MDMFSTHLGNPTRSEERRNIAFHHVALPLLPEKPHVLPDRSEELEDAQNEVSIHERPNAQAKQVSWGICPKNVGQLFGRLVSTLG